MQESGIYRNWITSYTNKRQRMEKSIVKYQAAKMKHFTGLIVICGVLTAFGILVFIFEFIVRKKSSKIFVTRNSSYFDRSLN